MSTTQPTTRAVGEPPGRDGAPARPRTAARTARPPLFATPPALGVLAAIAAIAWLAAPAIATGLMHVLPASATVRSSGTFFPKLRDALPFTIRTATLSLLAAGLVSLAAFRLRGRVRWPRWGTYIVLAVLVAGAGAIYGYFGYPHNGLAGNARIHWVDISSIRAGDWWYTLVKFPHKIFYNEPFLLQALNGALNVGLMYAIGRRLFKTGAMPLVLALTYLASSLMLAFSSTAEDVQLNVAALLFAYLCYLRRSTPWLGVALFVVVLGRPQLVLVGMAFLVSEFVCSPERGLRKRLRGMRDDRFVVVNVLVALGVFVAWDLFLVARHQNWLLRNGHLLSASAVHLRPVPVDGFTISAFSGAYVLHAIWIYPAAMLLAALISVVRFRQLEIDARRALVFGLVTVGTGLAVSEAEPLFYYNVRYLSYLLPFLMVAAFTVLTLPPRGRILLGRTATAALLCLGVTTAHWEAFRQHEALVRSPIVRTYAHRDEIKRLVGNAKVAVSPFVPSVKNYVCYILHRSIYGVDEIAAGAPYHGFVITASDRVHPRGVLVWQDGHVRIYRQP